MGEHSPLDEEDPGDEHGRQKREQERKVPPEVKPEFSENEPLVNQKGRQVGQWIGDNEGEDKEAQDSEDAYHDAG